MVTFITELSVAASFDAIYPYARSITTSSSGTTGDLHEEHKYLFSNDSWWSSTIFVPFNVALNDVNRSLDRVIATSSLPQSLIVVRVVVFKIRS